MDIDLPAHINYFLVTSKKDCFFVVGPESGPHERIGALKMFLKAHSEPLRNMLGDSALAEQGDISLIDIYPNIFWIFLKCIYGASDIVIPKLCFEESTKLLYILDKYLVTKSIRDTTVQHMIQELSYSNVFIALSNEVCLQQEVLENAILKVIQCNTETFFSDESFVELCSDGLLWLVQQDSLNTPEIAIWTAVLNWAKERQKTNNGRGLRNCIENHIKFVRFCAMSCEDFCKYVVPNNILTYEEVVEICKSFGTENAPALEEMGLCSDAQSRCQVVKSLDFGPPKQTITFHHIVNNITEFQNNQKSIDFIFLECSWNILVVKRDNPIAFGLFLNCLGIANTSSNETISNWTCSVAFNLMLVNQCGKPNKVLHVKHTFCKEEKDWGFQYFYAWHDLLDPINGFIKNDTIVVGVEVSAT